MLSKLNYTDDHQIYHSDVDPHVVDTYICNDVEKANQWYSQSGMLVNIQKHKAFYHWSNWPQASLVFSLPPRWVISPVNQWKVWSIAWKNIKLTQSRNL